MSVTNRVEKISQELEKELAVLASSLEGTVSEGKISFASKTSDLPRIEFPVLKGTYGGMKVYVMFSPITDTQRAIAGRITSRASSGFDDYLKPWFQAYVYHASPFRMWLTAEKGGKKSFLSRIMENIGLAPVEIEVGVPSLDDRYFFECQENRQAARSFLKKTGIEEKLEALGAFHLLRFDDSYLKLVYGEKDPGNYKAGEMLTRIRALADVAGLL